MILLGSVFGAALFPGVGGIVDFSIAYAEEGTPPSFSYAHAEEEGTQLSFSPVYAEEETDAENEESTGAAIEDETVVAVADIVISEYKDKLKIGETTDLYVTVLPKNATDQDVTYTTSDSLILSVNANGQVKGLATGEADISVSAGDFTKTVRIAVTGAQTAAITPNKEFLVLKPGDLFRLTVSVLPQDAEQVLQFKSQNTKVAEVSADGTIKAIGLGNTSVTVSNGDMTAAVSVIVNRTNATGDRGSTGAGNNAVDTARILETSEAERAVINKLEAGDGGHIDVLQANCPIITKAILKTLQRIDATLTVTGEKYSLSVAGADITNFENEVNTDIAFETKGDELSFDLNNGENLPGTVRITLTEGFPNYAYLYLYNETKAKYERLDAKSGNGLFLDEAGDYLLTNQKLNMMPIKIIWVIGAGALIAAGIVAYIVIRRRYWFW